MFELANFSKGTQGMMDAVVKATGKGATSIIGKFHKFTYLQAWLAMNCIHSAHTNDPLGQLLNLPNCPSTFLLTLDDGVFRVLWTHFWLCYALNG